MEDKSMKLTTLTIPCSCFLLLVSLVNGENKSIAKDKFMRINPNITNVALRAELENLGKEFGEKREALFTKYGENRKKTKPAINPNMEKVEKGKKPLRKSK